MCVCVCVCLCVCVFLPNPALRFLKHAPECVVCLQMDAQNMAPAAREVKAPGKEAEAEGERPLHPARKKKAKGPNPLAVKKKAKALKPASVKTKAAGVEAAKAAVAEGDVGVMGVEQGGEARRRRRKRKAEPDAG